MGLQVGQEVALLPEGFLAVFMGADERTLTSLLKFKILMGHLHGV